MNEKAVKAYVITNGKAAFDESAEYGVVICNAGKPIIKLNYISNQVKIAQRFVDMINNSFE